MARSFPLPIHLLSINQQPTLPSTPFLLCPYCLSFQVLTAEGIAVGCLVKKIPLGSVLDQSSKNKKLNRNKEAPDHWLVKLDGQDDDFPFSEHAFGKLVDVFPDAMETSESDTSIEEAFAPLPTTKDDATTTTSTAATGKGGSSKESTTTRGQKQSKDTDVVMSPETASTEAPEKTTRQTRHSSHKTTTSPITPERLTSQEEELQPSQPPSASMIQTRSGRRTPPRSTTPPPTRRPPRKAAKTVAKQARVQTRRSGPTNSRVVSLTEQKTDVLLSLPTTEPKRPTHKAPAKAVVSKTNSRKNQTTTAAPPKKTKQDANNVETIVYSTGILYIYKGKKRRGAKFVPTK